MFIKFFLSGGLATLFQYVLLEIGITYFLVSASIASGVGYLGGSILNYLLNYFFTFQSKKSHVKTTLKFYVMVVFGWFSNILLMWIMVDNQGFNVWISQFFTTIIVFMWNFFISKLWVFKI